MQEGKNKNHKLFYKIKGPLKDNTFKHTQKSSISVFIKLTVPSTQTKQYYEQRDHELEK